MRVVVLAAHARASEPDLAELGAGGVDRAAMAAALRLHLPDSVVCIQILATAGAGRMYALARDGSASPGMRGQAGAALMATAVGIYVGAWLAGRAGIGP